jgi:hypothetical protein
VPTCRWMPLRSSSGCCAESAEEDRDRGWEGVAGGSRGISCARLASPRARRDGESIATELRALERLRRSSRDLGASDGVEGVYPSAHRARHPARRAEPTSTSLWKG